MPTDRIPLAQVQDKVVDQTAQEQQNLHEGPWEGTLSYMDDINYHRMADFLDIPYVERRDQHLAEQLTFLTEWAQDQTKSDDRLKHQLAIKQLINGLGYQMKGSELVKKLYMWTRLDQDRKRIEQKMELLK